MGNPPSPAFDLEPPAEALPTGRGTSGGLGEGEKGLQLRKETAKLPRGNSEQKSCVPAGGVGYP